MNLKALLACGILLVAWNDPGWGAGIPLVVKGHSDYVIVLGKDASPSEKTGATDVQAQLEKITGAHLEIVVAPATLPQHAILIGRGPWTERLQNSPDWTALGDEGFLLRTDRGHIIIAGSPVRGTMYGCTAFLEKLGARFCTPTFTMLPHDPDLTVPPLDETQKPVFHYREVYIGESGSKEWAAHLGLNGMFPRLGPETGGADAFCPNVHTMDKLVPRDLYATHPEYFALINGKRMDGYQQRAMSNPDVLKITIENVALSIKQNPDIKYIDVSQNDTGTYCLCDKCTTIANQYGGQSGLYLWFVNQVADAIAKDHPDKVIETLAYEFTEAPPTSIVPRNNVAIRLCPISCSELRPYEESTDPTTVTFLDHLKGWEKLSHQLYIWHYIISFSNYLMPFPDFHEMAADLRVYEHNGVQGVMTEGSDNTLGASDSDLRAYLLGKLMWNPDADADALTTEWLHNVYGPAWKPMREWFDSVQSASSDKTHEVHVFDSPTRLSWLFTPEFLASGDRLFDEAMKLAEGNTVATYYIRKNRIPLEYVKIVLHRPGPDTPEFQKFLADAHEFGVVRTGERKTLDEWVVAYRHRARPWWHLW